MGDMARATHALSLMAFGIPHIVFLAETPSALAVNLGGPKHVQTLVRALVVVVVAPTFQALPLGPQVL